MKRGVISWLLQTDPFINALLKRIDLVMNLTARLLDVALFVADFLELVEDFRPAFLSGAALVREIEGVPHSILKSPVGIRTDVSCEDETVGVHGGSREGHPSVPAKANAGY